MILKNANFRFTPEIQLHIHTLDAELVPISPASIVNFDDNYMINSSFVIGNYISPHSRVFSSLTQINAFFCLFGGIENYVYFNDLWLYDIPNKLWQLSKPLGTSPSPRASHAAASSGDALLI